MNLVSCSLVEKWPGVLQHVLPGCDRSKTCVLFPAALVKRIRTVVNRSKFPTDNKTGSSVLNLLVFSSVHGGRPRWQDQVIVGVIPPTCTQSTWPDPLQCLVSPVTSSPLYSHHTGRFSSNLCLQSLSTSRWRGTVVLTHSRRFSLTTVLEKCVVYSPYFNKLHALLASISCFNTSPIMQKVPVTLDAHISFHKRKTVCLCGFSSHLSTSAPAWSRDTDR